MSTFDHLLPLSHTPERMKSGRLPSATKSEQDPWHERDRESARKWRFGGRRLSDERVNRKRYRYVRHRGDSAVPLCAKKCIWRISTENRRRDSASAASDSPSRNRGLLKRGRRPLLVEIFNSDTHSLSPKGLDSGNSFSLWPCVDLCCCLAKSSRAHVTHTHTQSGLPWTLVAYLYFVCLFRPFSLFWLLSVSRFESPQLTYAAACCCCCFSVWHFEMVKKNPSARTRPLCLSLLREHRGTELSSR